MEGFPLARRRARGRGGARRGAAAVVWAVLAAASVSAQAPASPPRLAPSSFVSLDFDNADIRVVVKHISELTGRNFLLDEKVRGRVTIITPARIRVSDVYPVFLSILNTYGFTAVPSGKVTRIVPLGEAARTGLPAVSAEELQRLSAPDRFVTSILSLRHAKPSALSSLLRPMVAREGSLLAYEPSNALILTDTAANVRRLTAVIAKLDIPPETARVEVARLKYAQARDLAETLKKLVKENVTAGPVGVPVRRRGGRIVVGARDQSPKKLVRIIPEERVNALILVAPPSEMVRVRSLVKKLDVPPPPERKRIHIYRLENAVAEDLAQVLNREFTAQAESVARAERGERSPRAGSASRPPIPRIRTLPGVTGGAPLLKDVTITPDKATNSLIVRASPEDYDSLVTIIRQLDVRRSQVLVEGLIAEMTLDKARQLGVEWRLKNEPSASGSSVIGGTSFPPPGSTQGALNQFATGPFGGPSGLVLGLARGFVTFGDRTFFDIRSLVRAFQSDSDINVLSTPQILTSDNEEAEIIVGENRPFVTQSQTTAEGSTVQTFEFRDVGVTLRITPHISPNRFVRLKIFMEITSFVQEAQVGAVTTTKRQATTSVTVEDAQTVVIGGLIRDDTTDAENKVPLLGEIPILGGLFRSQSKRKVKTNLLIFITPRTILTPEEHSQLTEFKKGQTGQDLLLKKRSAKEGM